MFRRHWFLCFIALAGLTSFLAAQEKKTAPIPEAKPGKEMPDQAALFKKFAETMTGAKLVGNFTVDGMPMDKLIKEEYHIISAEKADKGDYWLITARVKYGKTDITLPMPLEVKWAGKTPVITLDEVTIPGLGTFDAKVVIDGKRYAGTWQHGAFGGLLFGAIERDNASKTEEKKESKEETPPKSKTESLPGAPARDSSAAPAPTLPSAGRKLDPLPPAPTKPVKGRRSLSFDSQPNSRNSDRAPPAKLARRLFLSMRLLFLYYFAAHLPAHDAVPHSVAKVDHHPKG